MTTKNKPGKGSKSAKGKPAKKSTPASGRTTRKIQKAKAAKPRKPRSDKGTKVAKDGVAAPRVPEHKPREELAQPHPVDVLLDIVKRSGQVADLEAFEEARRYYDQGGALNVTVQDGRLMELSHPAMQEVRIVNAIDPESALLLSEEVRQKLLELMSRTDTSRPAPMIVHEPFIQPPHNEHLDGDDDGLGAARGFLWALAISACIGFASWAAWEAYHLAKLAGWF